MSINIRIDQGDLADVEKMLKGLKGGAPKVLTRAINKTVTQSKKRASQEIRKDLNLSAAYVNGSAAKGLRSKLFTSRATWRKLSGRLSAEKRGVLMTRYPHTELKRGGVTVKIKRGGARIRMPGAFVTHVNAGSSKRVPVVAIPKHNLGRYTTGNLKMKVLYSPSVSQALGVIMQPDGPGSLSRELLEFYFDQTQKQIDTVLRGY